MKEKIKVDEIQIVTIIASAGEALSLMQQAYQEVVLGNNEKAEELLSASEEALTTAHLVQTKLIQSEAGGEEVEMTLLMVHAQDHLMNAILTKQLIQNQIEMQKQINAMKGGK